MASGLAVKIVTLHRAFDTADIPHAFGGALALAYCTAEPRSTRDIDVNVFCEPGDWTRIEAALPDAIAVSEADRTQVRRDGQARLWWDNTPVDLFLSNHPFHAHVAANRRTVPFADVGLPVLSCADLAVFKAFFARPKDALDVATMAQTGSVDLDDLSTTVTALLGGDERADFLDRVRDLAAELRGG